jgi:plastocyanin
MVLHGHCSVKHIKETYPWSLEIEPWALHAILIFSSNSVAIMIKASLFTFTILCLPLVGAQYGGGGSSDTTTTTASSTESGSASSTTQSVDVGESGFTFNPDTIHVPAGGVVEFHFYPGDHSVAQAAFNNPCHPKSDTSFFSGFMASANNGKVIMSIVSDSITF